MKSLKRVFDSRELLWNLTLRELRTKYRRSLPGWAIFNRMGRRLPEEV
jgi:ABC-type polysaccharide/polyol phosphate export permease